ncbi:MAG: cupin domain-containing protein [Candidatus Lokiarchaeota archaeon]|nr:cupin domain-containing protein [Candidatus Lokiarchaeota archaeon]MBD3340799.1 cupin domain-containing protein [Candidatus Lokiarchaeota archaeon]
MKIIDKSEVEVAKTPHKVDVRKLFSFEHATIVHIELKPGEALKKHITPVDVTFYVLEGEGSVEIGEERKDVIKGQLIFSPAKIPHKLLNNSDKDFSFLVIKTPTPTSETKIL